MKHKTMKAPLIAIATLLLLVNSAWANDSVASASASGSYLDFSPVVSSAILLEVTNGFEFAYREVFEENAPSFSSVQDDRTLADGQYTFQLTSDSERQSGTFEVTGGNITLNEGSAEDKRSIQ